MLDRASVDGARKLRRPSMSLARSSRLGVPSLKGQQTGDQVIKVKIQIPTKLSVKQRELLTEFAKESGVSLDTEGDGFFDKMKTFFE